MKQKENDPALKAEEFLNDDVETVEDAIAGASDIIAEWISEDEKARKQLRISFEKEAVIIQRLLRAKRLKV
jgi:uncharacterized protein